MILSISTISYMNASTVLMLTIVFYLMLIYISHYAHCPLLSSIFISYMLPITCDPLWWWYDDDDEVMIMMIIIIHSCIFVWIALLLFLQKIISEIYSSILQQQQQQLSGQQHGSIIGIGKLNPNFIIITIFTSNFIGICFARTLHYQFYSWYFHTLPFLLWHCRDQLSIWMRLVILITIEISFNVFPATSWSSILLQVTDELMYKCMYVSKYICTYICIYEGMYECMFVCMTLWMNINL